MKADEGVISPVLVGNDAAMTLSFGSTCHGAGLAHKVARLKPLGVVKG